MHANVASCAIFAATSGSSVATAATIGTLAVPEIRKQGYNERLFLGSLAAGGTLGILIPPSINLIIYGLLTRTSITELYLAALLPGILLTVLFSLVVLVPCLIVPRWGGQPARSNWAARLRSLPDVLPPIGIFLAVVGSIYAGVATPTEAASFGVVVALVYTIVSGSFSLDMLRRSLEGTMRTTAVIMLIIIAAMLLNFVLAALGASRTLSGLVTSLQLSPFGTLMTIMLMYVVLGCFLETLSLTFLTVPFVVPIIVQLGYDPVWFGVVFIVLLETALITPPVGINLYVIQGVRRAGSLNEVAIGSLPFVIALAALIALLIAFPSIALWLPKVAA